MLLDITSITNLLDNIIIARLQTMCEKCEIGCWSLPRKVTFSGPVPQITRPYLDWLEQKQIMENVGEFVILQKDQAHETQNLVVTRAWV